MPAFSFIHVSDLHLDTPLRGLAAAPPAVAELLQTATLDAFDALLRLCLEQDAAFLIVAGDALDGADRNLRAQRIFRDGLARLAERGIQSFVAFGSNDARETWSAALEWPGGVHLFSTEQVESVVVSRQGVPLARISGISHAHPAEERDLARLFKADPPGLFQIAVLHAACGADPDQAPASPCTLEQLTGAGFDYWALGGLHRPALLSQTPAVVYPGALQGRAGSESGAHGGVLVTVGGDRKARVEFIPLDAVRWEAAEVSIAGLASAADLGQLISQTLDRLREASQGRVVLARILLHGHGPLYYELTRTPLLRQLLEQAHKIGAAEDPAVWVESLEPRCQPEIDLERRSHGQDLLGQVLATARDLREGGLPQQLAPVLAPLFQEGQARRALDPLSPQELEAILADAELLCLDQLEKNL